MLRDAVPLIFAIVLTRGPGGGGGGGGGLLGRFGAMPPGEVTCRSSEPQENREDNYFQQKFFPLDVVCPIDSGWQSCLSLCSILAGKTVCRFVLFWLSELFVVLSHSGWHNCLSFCPILAGRAICRFVPLWLAELFFWVSF